MGTLLITGGAGFIGSNLVQHALDHTADRLVVFDKLTYAGSLLNLDKISGLGAPRSQLDLPAKLGFGFNTSRRSRRHRPD